MPPSMRARRAGYVARSRFTGVNRRLSALRRTSTRRPFRYTRPLRLGASSNEHSYRRWGTPNTATITYPAESYSATDTFALANVTNPTELTNLYDQYKIKMVVMKIRLVNVPEGTYRPGIPSADSQGSNYYPRFWYYRDYDDNTPVTDLATMREVGKAKCITLKPDKEYRIKVKPAVAVQVYRTAVSTGYAPMWPRKLDCTQSDIPHYGVKWFFDGLGITRRTGDQWILKIEYQYYLTMYNTR